MSRVNQPPIGLQDFLGNQNFGENPNTLSSTLLPSVDLTPFLGSQQLSFARNSGSRSGVGVAVSQTVPQGEAWFMLSVAVNQNTSVTAGAQCVGITLTNVPGLPGISIKLATSQYVSIGVNEFVPAVWQPPIPVMFEAGTTINCHAFAIPGAGPDFYEITSMFYRLKI